VIRRIGQVCVACLLLAVVEAQAVPVSFQFAANAQSFGTTNGGVPVPGSFYDSAFVSTPISGAFTIETDTLGTPAYIYQDGGLLESGAFYLNPVTELAFNIGDQQFNFATSSPPAGSNIRESTISVIDRPVPSTNPLTNYDSYNFAVYFGPGVFSGPYSHLSASLSLVRMERDLSLISSGDLLANLEPSENWDLFFTILDSASPSQNYQIHAPVTNLTQVSSVPEPGTSALLALGLVLTVAAVRARRQTS
jgi:hypothetical protein